MPERFCPKCTQAMSGWNAGDLELDHCARCKALWFDENELSRHLFNMAEAKLDENPSKPTPSTLPCPACGDSHYLESTLLHDISVESCPACGGVFLDLGEIHDLLGKIAPPPHAKDPGSSLRGFDSFALGMFVGMRRGSSSR